jgi:ParB family chromosome partitioning protein
MLKVIPLNAIRENQVALRTVNKQSEDFLGLCESIRQKGFMGAISVREKNDPETGENFYELVDGLHRYTAAKEVGLEEINVDVVSLDDDQVLEAQIMANIHKVETKPVEYSRQLKRILMRNQLMTEAELAEKLGKSTSWIKARLGLNKIDNEEVLKLIDSGDIPLANAYPLAKLPPEELPEFIDRAMTLPPDEFNPIVTGRLKEINDAKRKGKKAEEAEFQPVAFMQKMKDIKAEMEAQEIKPILCDGLQTPQEGFDMALKWVLHIDPKSVEQQRAEDEERKAARKAAREKKKKEREEKKKAEAAEAAVETESNDS